MTFSTLPLTWALIAAAGAPGAADSGPRNVVLCTDMALGMNCVNVYGGASNPADCDDGWALAWALTQEDWNVLAVVVSFGNCSAAPLDTSCTGIEVPGDCSSDVTYLDQSMAVASWIVASSGRAVPVFEGANCRFTRDGATPAGTAAAIELIRDAEQPVDVIGIGPGTDLAYMIRDLGSLGELERIGGLVLEMGQFGIHAGEAGFELNGHQVSDYNLRADPGSLAWMLESVEALPPLTFVPFNAVRQGLVTQFMLESMDSIGGPILTRTADACVGWSLHWTTVLGESGFHLWDLVCVLSQADGALFDTQAVHASVTCVDDAPSLQLQPAASPTGITCAFHLSGMNAPLAARPIRFYSAQDTERTADQNAIPQLGLQAWIELARIGR